MPLPKISHIFGTERPMNFKLGIWMEYDSAHHWPARCPPRGELWVAVTSQH